MTVRLAVPGVLAVALLVLVRAIESFDVPLLVGLPGGVHVLSTMIFVDIHANYPPDYGGASAVAVVLLLLVALFLFINRRFTAGKDKYATVGGKPVKRRPSDLGGWRYAATLGTFAYGLVLIVIPGAAIVLTSLRKFSGAITFSKSTVDDLTLNNFVTVLSSPMAVRSGVDSLIVATAAATVAILITAVGGWWSARARLGGGAIGQLGNFPIIFPSIVLALALLRVFLRVPIPIYATLWALIIAYIVKAVPYGMQYAQVGTVQFKSELEESARTSGAGLARMLRKVVVPLLRPALVSGWLYVFLLTARDLPIALLLYGPDSPVVTTTLYGFWEGGQVVEAAAAGVVWSIMLTVVSLCIYLATRRRGGSFEGS